MADKRIHATIAYSGDNDNMNSAHPLQIVWRAGHSSRQQKGNENAIKNGWYDLYNFDPVWMEEDCKYHTIKPSKI
jgi:hypothetical protein